MVALKHDMPITAAQLSGNFAETLFYGMYIVTCGFCARTLLLIGREERWRKASEIRWMMVGVAISLFVIATFDVAIGLLHNIEAFVQYKGSDGAAGELTDISNWINIARSVNQVCQMVIGDFVLIYRCYIVYARRWPVVVPSFILYLGGIAMAIKLIYAEASLHHAKITLNSGPIQPWWRAFFAITAVQNTMTTSLLIWRIWRVERQMEGFRASRPGSHVSTANSQPKLRKVIRVIAESGAAYTSLVVLTFIVSAVNSTALYPTSDATLQATGIAFNVIIVRSSMSREEEFTNFDNQERTMAEQGGGGGGGYNMHSLQFTPGGKRRTAFKPPSNNIVSFKSTVTDDTAVDEDTKRQSDERPVGPVVSIHTQSYTTTDSLYKQRTDL